MISGKKQIICRTITLLLSSCVLTIANAAATAVTTPAERIAKVAEVDLEREAKIQPAPLITFETISFRSGDLLGIPKAKQFQDTIMKAMESAYKTNPDILAQRAALRAADEAIVQAKAGWRPKLNATISGGYGKTYNKGDTINNSQAAGGNPALVSDKGTHSAQLQLTQNLYNGGATVAQTESAKANIKAQRAALIETEQGTLFTAIQAYLDLITQLAQLEVLRANENFLKITLQSTQDKFNVGEETRTSVAQAEAQQAEAIAKRQSAEAQLAAKIATYTQVTGRAPGKLQKPEVPKGLPKSVKQALDQARLNNPTVLKAQYTEIAARRKVDEFNAGLLPKLDLVGTSSAEKTRSLNNLAGTPAGLGPTTSSTNDTTVNHQVTLNLTFPLYEAGSVRSQKRQAIESAEQTRIQIEGALRKIEQQLIAAFQNFEAAQSNLKYYKEQVLANEISVEGTKQEMLVGSKILLDVLNAQNKLLDAQLSLVQVEQTLYISAYQIMVLMGMLTAKYMQLQVEHYDPTLHYQEIKSTF